MGNFRIEVKFYDSFRLSKLLEVGKQGQGYFYV